MTPFVYKNAERELYNLQEEAKQKKQEKHFVLSEKLLE